MTDATTSAGIDGRPRAEGNRSSNSESENSFLRWSAKEASNAALRDEVAAQGRSVKELTVRTRAPLQLPILVAHQTHREHRRRVFQQPLAGQVAGWKTGRCL